MRRFDTEVGYERFSERATGDLSITISVRPARSGRRFSIALSSEGKELALKEIRVGSRAKGKLYHAIRAGFTRLSKS